jgi:NAD(P)-dependent dehydrogenase (short-subunit alcohol dehydrogenase family)
MAEPADVADVCVFLASPLARYVTGAQVLVHGGGERPGLFGCREGNLELMRFIVYGAGAIGGAIGGRLAQHGNEVVLIARGGAFRSAPRRWAPIGRPRRRSEGGGYRGRAPGCDRLEARRRRRSWQ